jgi:PqqD family protein of HPr-rel-A system
VECVGFEQRLVVRWWQDGCVVFDRFSGDTHALDRLTARVFAQTRRGPPQPAELSLLLSSEFPGVSALELEQRVNEALKKLRVLDLIGSTD